MEVAVSRIEIEGLENIIDRERIVRLLNNYSNALRNFRSSGRIELGIEGAGAGIGLVKGVVDGNLLYRVLSYEKIGKSVELPFDYSSMDIIDLPVFFGKENSPIVQPGDTTSWYYLCQSLGIKAQNLAPIAGLAIGLGVGSLISSAVGYYLDNRRIFRPLEEIVRNVDSVREDILEYKQLRNASRGIKSHIRNAFNRIKGFYRKLKTVGRAIKSVGTMVFAYLAIRFIYNVISLLLGLNNVPDVINTVEDANFWAKFVYDTIMTAKDLMPVAEQYAPIVLGGAIGSYGIGKGLEIYADRGIRRGVEYIRNQIEELANLYSARVVPVSPEAPVTH